MPRAQPSCWRNFCSGPGGARVVLAPEAPQEVGACRVVVAVLVDRQAVEQLERCFGSVELGDGDCPVQRTVTSLSATVSFFSVVTLDDELVGEALLWGIDTHNRCAQVGLAFLPGFRCRNSR